MHRFLQGNPQVAALPLDVCFAKTFTQADGTTTLGHTVFEHCCIVGEVARALAALYPEYLQKEFFPEGTPLLVGSHDTGKVSPQMQEKLRRAIQGYQPNSLLELSSKSMGNLESSETRHAIISEAAVYSYTQLEYLGQIAGMHHGVRESCFCNPTAEIYGGQAWNERRIELLKHLEAYFATEWPLVKNDTQVKVLAGLTTVADWIGSGTFFESPENSWQGLIEQGVVNAGFVAPQIKPGLSFQDIFEYAPYPVQTTLAELCHTPGVYILEAPMGLGKTEAALYAAYRMLERKQATGIYFALPTRLTSNKIYERFSPFLHAILQENSPHREALLLHGNAHLHQCAMGAEAAPAQEWFCSLKRAILAPFGVGTVDQALFSALPDVRHSFVRTFGLLGKVVILDEVHTYDSYTGIILDSLIEQLRQLSCTVIILSATVTRDRRQLILGSAPQKQGYPLISVQTKGNGLQEYEVAPLKDRCVGMHLCEQREEALLEALQRAEEGQQVLWIENTIAEAQETYRQIAAAAANVETGLLHSRFLQKDRDQHEKYWIQFFGKEGTSLRYAKGRILVGTQVLEQSLDIDADFLVSQICPTDMFLQRLGRLWRHDLPGRHCAAKPEVFLLVPPAANLAEPSKESFGKTGNVYSPYILYRSLEVIKKYKEILLPGHIRTLLEATYKDREEQGALARLKATFVHESEVYKRMAGVAMSALGQKLRDTAPVTRYSEIDTCPVLLVKSLNSRAKGVEVLFLDGTRVFFPFTVKAYNKHLWRELATTLAQNTVSVALSQAPKPCTVGWLGKWLTEYVYMGTDNSAFRVALVNDAGKLYALDQSSVHATYTISYASHLGYSVQKTKEGS